MQIKKACFYKRANAYRTRLSIGREPQCDSLYLTAKDYITKRLSLSKIIFSCYGENIIPCAELFSAVKILN